MLDNETAAKLNFLHAGTTQTTIYFAGLTVTLSEWKVVAGGLFAGISLVGFIA